MFELPTSISTGETELKIRENGDFRMILDCFATLEDEELKEEERLIACLMIFYEDLNSITSLSAIPDIKDAIQKMYWFFNCGQEDSSGKHAIHKLIDWEKDQQLIVAAINKLTSKEIRLESYIHWWTFMGYYVEIGDSQFSTIVNIRDKLVKGKKLEKYEREFKMNNPHHFVWNARTAQQKEDDDWVRQLWNSE